MAKKLTGIIILLVIGALIIYDIIIAIWGGPGSTISEVILKAAWQHPFWPLAGGVLVGHLTWPSYHARQARCWRITLLVSVGVAALLVDVLLPLPKVMPAIPVLLGIGIGHMLWPQVALE